jgi:hypothetical protein
MSLRSLSLSLSLSLWFLRVLDQRVRQPAALSWALTLWRAKTRTVGGGSGGCSGWYHAVPCVDCRQIEHNAVRLRLRFATFGVVVVLFGRNSALGRNNPWPGIVPTGVRNAIALLVSYFKRGVLLPVKMHKLELNADCFQRAQLHLRLLALNRVSYGVCPAANRTGLNNDKSYNCSNGCERDRTRHCMPNMCCPTPPNAGNVLHPWSGGTHSYLYTGRGWKISPQRALLRCRPTIRENWWQNATCRRGRECVSI